MQYFQYTCPKIIFIVYLIFKFYYTSVANPNIRHAYCLFWVFYLATLYSTKSGVGVEKRDKLFPWEKYHWTLNNFLNAECRTGTPIPKAYYFHSFHFYREGASLYFFRSWGKRSINILFSSKFTGCWWNSPLTKGLGLIVWGVIPGVFFCSSQEYVILYWEVWVLLVYLLWFYFN